MEVKVIPLQSHQALRRLIDDYWLEVKQAGATGKKVAWCSAIAPTELLSAFDFTLVFPENYGAICGTRRVSTEFCEMAEGYGYSQDICSYVRNTLGPALADRWDKCPVGGLPKPDLLLVCNNSCITITKWYEVLSRLYKVPLLVLDVPFLHGQNLLTPFINLFIQFI